MQSVYTRGTTDVESIQGILEFGLKKVLRLKEAHVSISSRTDAGVHAIESACHYDYKGNLQWSQN